MTDDHPAADESEPLPVGPDPLVLPEPPDSRGLLALALRIFRERGWTAFLAGLPATAVGTAIVVPVLAMMPRDEAALDAAASGSGGGLVIAMLLVFVAGLIFLCAYAATYLAMLPDGGESGEALTWREAAKQAPLYAPTYLLNFLLLMILMLPLVMAGTALLAAFAVSGFDLGGGQILGGLLAGGLFLLLSARWVAAHAAIAAERAGAAAALGRSWRLVKGRTWRVAGLVLSTWLVNLAGTMLAGLLVVPFGEGTAAAVIGGAVSILASVLSTLLAVALSVAVFLDGESREDGLPAAGSS